MPAQRLVAGRFCICAFMVALFALCLAGILPALPEPAGSAAAALAEEPSADAGEWGRGQGHGQSTETSREQGRDREQNLPLLVIVVEFAGDANNGGAGAVAYDDSYDWGSSIFGNDSLASYYRDMSGGTFTFAPAPETSATGVDGNHNAFDRAGDGVVHVTLPQAHGAWGLVNEDESISEEFAAVVMDAFEAASFYASPEAYDANIDDAISPDELAVCVCVAGLDASTLGDPARNDIPTIWPHAGIVSDKAAAGAALKLDSYIAIAEHLWNEYDPPDVVSPEPVGILYHELGHYLGLPDLYALNDNPQDAPWGAYAVGPLSLMDNGGWVETVLADGTKANEPTAMDAWSRYVLGWKMPRIVTESGSYDVRSQLSDRGYQSLLVPTRDPDQFYLIENRQPEGHDAALAGEYAMGNPRGGIVVWHVDKGMYRDFGAANTANDSDHRPAVMELYFEATPDTGAYTTDWSWARPYTAQPFYDAQSCAANYGDELATVALPLYNDADDVPAARVNSDVTVQFPTQSARDMTVNITFADTAAATGMQAYPLDDETFGQLCTQGGPLGDVACAALLQETRADVALVDVASIRSGLPEGAIAWSGIASMLPDDSTVHGYYLTGSQIASVLEESLDRAAHCRKQLAAGSVSAADAGKVLLAGGLSYAVDWNAHAGARLSDVLVGTQPISADQRYYVAVTQGAEEAYGLFGSVKRDILVLWGSPADALRSFMLNPAWEDNARALAGTKTYRDAPAVSHSANASDSPAGIGGSGLAGLPLAPVALGAVALGIVLLGAISFARRR